jgi:ubiquinone/menaquinone biosynthesis C-methylase UbiE
VVLPDLMTQTAGNTPWGASYRMIAAEKWRRKSGLMGRAATRALVEFARVQSGMQVLDLASGTGEPAISVASLVGPGGSVIGIDLNAAPLEIAAARARERHLANLRFQTGDAQALPFADASFDLITSRLGVMFFDDIGRALREAHRVLKPEGRAAFLVWGPVEQPYFQSTVALVYKQVGGPLLLPASANLFRFAVSGSLPGELQAAGFRTVQEELRTVPWVWEGPPEEMWEYFREVSAPFRPLLDSVPPSKAAALERDVLAAIGRFYDGERVNLSATFLLVGAQK